jgi:hypothetical protein
MAQASHELIERARARRYLTELQTREDLLRYIPFVTPEYVAPVALAPICALFDRIMRGEQVFACIQAPPRHGKSHVLFHGVARLLRWRPRTRVGYVSYNEIIAAQQSREAWQVAARAGVVFESPAKHGGVRVDPSASVRHWQTAAGGGFQAVGRHGGIVGTGVDLLISDDPIKERAEAESPAFRDSVWQAFTDSQFTRREPGASVLVCHQRWNDDDLIARVLRLAEENPNAPRFELVSLPALNEHNEPLWPERFDVHALAQIRAVVGEHTWWGQFMQAPRPKGGSLFGEAARYPGKAQLIGRRVVISVDAAGTAKTSADHTAITITVYWRQEWVSPDGTRLPGMLHGQVLRCYRFQLETPDVVRVLDQLQRDWPGAPVVIESQGGSGQTTAQTLRRLQPALRITEVPRTVDKFTAAQPCAAGWNQGRLMAPLQHDTSLDSVALQKLLRQLGVWDEGQWLAPYLKEFARFTGLAGGEDDQVDATVHGWDFAEAMSMGSAQRPVRGPRKAAQTGGF